MIQSFNDILAFQSSKKLYIEIVKLAEHFPPVGFHLRDQVCRSANSIHANIAEGFGRSVPEFKMYLTRSLGSCNETKSHIEDATNLQWIDDKTGKRLIDEYTIVSKQLFRLREAWR